MAPELLSSELVFLKTVRHMRGELHVFENTTSRKVVDSARLVFAKDTNTMFVVLLWVRVI